MAPRNVVIRFGSQHPALQQIDPNTASLYAPHTVSALLLGKCSILGVLYFLLLPITAAVSLVENENTAVQDWCF